MGIGQPAQYNTAESQVVRTYQPQQTGPLPDSAVDFGDRFTREIRDWTIRDDPLIPTAANYPNDWFWPHILDASGTQYLFPNYPGFEPPRNRYPTSLVANYYWNVGFREQRSAWETGSITSGNDQFYPRVLDVSGLQRWFPNVDVFTTIDRYPTFLHATYYWNVGRQEENFRQLYARLIFPVIYTNNNIAHPAPVAPVAPTAPVAPITPVAPVAPTAPVVPTAPIAPTAPALHAADAINRSLVMKDENFVKDEEQTAMAVDVSEKEMDDESGPKQELNVERRDNEHDKEKMLVVNRKDDTAEGEKEIFVKEEPIVPEARRPRDARAPKYRGTAREVRNVDSPRRSEPNAALQEVPKKRRISSDSSDSQDGAPAAGGVQKRARRNTSQPCDRCRTRKVYCDREEPCGQCVSLGSLCHRTVTHHNAKSEDKAT